MHLTSTDYSLPDSSEPPLSDSLGEQKSAALLAQVDRLRHMLEVSPQVPWVADPHGKLIDFSERWLQLTGLTREQALANGWTEVPHPDDLPRMQQAWLESVACGHLFDTIYRMRAANGIYRWVRTRAYPYRENGGEITQWHGFTEDVEERVQAERALRASEQRYRSVVETAREGVWIVDALYATTFVNQRMADILGYEREEMLGREVEEFMHGEEREQFRSRRLERRSGRAAQYDGRYLRKNGAEVWMIVSVSPLADEEGQFSGAVAMMTDITDRKRWEQEQARLAAIVESSEDAIVSKDLNGVVTSWNAAAERIYGWKAEDILGRSKGLVIPADLPNELPNILAQIREGVRIAHYETRRVRKDGAIIDVAISVSPLKDSRGVVTGAATIVRDITERKRTERELERKQAEIEALNKRLTRSIKETHHRVKNNLQIVGGMIDLLAIEYSRTKTVPLEQVRRLGSHIETLAMLHDLLTTSLREVESDQRIRADLMVGPLIDLLERTSGSRRIVAHVQPVELLSKQAITLSLTINELVCNALKHGSGNVEVRFEQEGDSAALTVVDDGEGFPEDFDPSVQSNLGIELIESLVQSDLKGKVTFGNHPGGGGRVRAVFPLPQEAGSA